jgi:uncharacterized protein
MPLGPDARIGGINRYPVKSMLGEALDRAVVGPRGVVGDRAYAVIDTADGKVASAKNPGKWRTLLACRATFVAQPDPDPDAPPPVAVIATPGGREVRTDDPDVDAVLSEVLGRPVRLAGATAATGAAPASPVLDEVWPHIDGLAPDEFVAGTAVGSNDAGETISAIAIGLLAPPGTYFDVSALHLLTTATLARLRELEPGASFDPRRYRPNLLVESDDVGFVENDWVGRTVGFGARLEAAIQLPTMRCVMTTLAHEDLPVDRATLRAIARHNRVEIENFGTWACAGAYATVATPGEVALGDPVSVRA